MRVNSGLDFLVVNHGIVADGLNLLDLHQNGLILRG